MTVQRIRRTSKYDEDEKCDCCDEPVTVGYRFSDGNLQVSGPRGYGLTICDECLKRAKASPIGFYSGEHS